MLPGSRAVIFTILKGPDLWDDTQIVVRSLDSGKQTVLVTGGSDGRYVSSGHLIYVRLGNDGRSVRPCSTRRHLGAHGRDRRRDAGADRNLSDMANTLAGQFTVSDTGALVYLGGAVAAGERSLAWVDRHGTSQALPAPPRPCSAHGSRPTASRGGRLHQGCPSVWSSTSRGALGPVTVDGQSDFGIFAPDGKRIVFRSGAAGGEDNLYWKAADGSGAVERLTTSARSQTPGSWSPDGTTLAFVEEESPQGSFSSIYGRCRLAIARPVR